MKSKKGITLIALVITILILLILAGISIQAITNDNGLFNRAKQTKNNTSEAQNLENTILLEYENAINKIDNSVVSGNTMAGKNDKSKNRALSGETNGYSYKNPIIPQGFFAVDEEDAIWKYTDNETVEGWNDGLVIQDDYGNQFVWVPVDGSSVTYSLLETPTNYVDTR